MNCKQGDLAIIVRGVGMEKYIGMVVQCIEPVVHPRWGWPGWYIGRPLSDGSNCVADAALKPINPGDEPDETLSWTQVPGERVPA
jgi:hypothetical protein